MSEMLEKARKYEEEQGKQIKAEDRPAFHVSPYVGWMNDPNGFSYYQGEYHLFYQYYPYDTHWDSMHWGHVVSKTYYIGNIFQQLLHQMKNTIRVDVFREVQ